MIVCWPRILHAIPGGRIIRYGAAAVKAHRLAALTCIVVGAGAASVPLLPRLGMPVPAEAPEAAHGAPVPFVPMPAIWGVGEIGQNRSVSVDFSAKREGEGINDVDCDDRGVVVGDLAGGPSQLPWDRLAPDVDVPAVIPIPVPEPAWVFVAPGIVLAFCRRVR